MASNSQASFVIGSSLPSTQAVYYDRLAVRAVFAHLGFQGLTAERQIPKNAGRTTQINKCRSGEVKSSFVRQTDRKFGYIGGLLKITLDKQHQVC
jgi:hypothetical protein